MTMVSYAQNFEDVMLWRALKHINNGFYVDVGANDPEVDSVTKWFYEQNWKGINIEPLAVYYNALLDARPQDVNIRCAVGNIDGELDIWECEIRGWATLNPDVAREHESKGYVGKWHTVPVKTLREVLVDYQNNDIHFMKVDVEGFELQVIQGNDWSKIKPWILVVEATQPNSLVENFADWESILIQVGYQFVYKDGINRYYVSNEHNELVTAFASPPNIFDDFISSSEMKTKEINNRLAQELDFVRQQLIDSKQQLVDSQLLVELSQNKLDSIYKSRSWRVTAPLRALFCKLRSLLSPRC